MIVYKKKYRQALIVIEGSGLFKAFPPYHYIVKSKFEALRKYCIAAELFPRDAIEEAMEWIDQQHGAGFVECSREKEAVK